MNTLVLNIRRDWDRLASTSLKLSAQLWFVIAMAGMWLFVYYIAGFYGGPTLQGNFEAWSQKKNLLHGYVRGDTFGNLQFAATARAMAKITSMDGPHFHHPRHHAERQRTLSCMDQRSPPSSVRWACHQS